MKKIITLLITPIVFLTSFAQQLNITGKVISTDDDKPVPNAVISLLTPGDSILYIFTRTNSEGRFSLKKIPEGNYIIMASQPLYADLLFDINANGDLALPDIKLISKSKLLQEVIVNSKTPFRIKGDTTIYTADSFKVSANANVAELLKKLPGIQVDKDGNIKAMGETVKRVLVDGEEFFGDDPGMAVKNLRADAVKEVQVFDKKSDQAEFSGIDDGKTQKTINLKLKDEAKKGYFGKLDAAAGPENHIPNRHNENLMLSSFRGKRKISGFLLNGNTGQDGLNWNDELKYGGNDNISISEDGDAIFFTSGGGNSDEEPDVNPQNGFMTNRNAGLQYTNKWNERYNLNLNPRYNSQQYTNHQQSFTRTQVGDSVLNNNSDETNNVNRHNFKLRGIADIKMDSMNSLKITAGANFYHTESDNFTNSVSTGNTGTLKNTSNRQLQTENNKSALSGTILFKHKFRKSRRTLSFTGNWYRLKNDGISFLNSTNQAYGNGLPAGKQDLNQMKNSDLNNSNISAQIIYTEPISKAYSLELSYRVAYNHGNNDQSTFAYSPDTEKYEFEIDSLSNHFRQNILQNIPAAKINFSNKKWKINVGSGFGFTDFRLRDITFMKDFNRSYVNYYPSANATFTYKPNHNIRFTYKGNTTQPTINQLQPLRNNNDFFNQYIGNPDLRPSFTNSFVINHSNYNFLNDFFTYQYFGLDLNANSITYNRMINVDSGKTITQPVNVNGNMMFYFYSGLSFKLRKIDTRFNVIPQFNYNRYADVINGMKSFSKTITPGLSLWVSKSKEKKYDLSISNEFTYNSNTTSQNDTRIHYTVNTIRFNGTIYVKEVWALISDYANYSRQKTLQFSDNLNTHILNARIQRTFRNNEFTTYISVNDIFNQNVGISRNFYSNTYSQVINDRLKRYFMVGFTWDFKNRKAGTQ